MAVDDRVAIVLAEEPAWLQRLREVLEHDPDPTVLVDREDLALCVAAVQDGPGGQVETGSDGEGRVVVQWDKLVRCVTMSPDEAATFAGNILTAVAAAKQEQDPPA